eukprot:comp21439_c0_seq1/m.29583 comp21439_c0_seq1/g.29583  ORF comp21439_c0_seq1/g.29583 comp21439_c0_seq1/m.29583 type:complete len:472 (-) comp21439_c0_seq1:428-1843(-)
MSDMKMADEIPKAAAPPPPKSQSEKSAKHNRVRRNKNKRKTTPQNTPQSRLQGTAQVLPADDEPIPQAPGAAVSTKLQDLPPLSAPEQPEPKVDDWETKAAVQPCPDPSFDVQVENSKPPISIAAAHLSKTELFPQTTLLEERSQSQTQTLAQPSPPPKSRGRAGSSNSAPEPGFSDQQPPEVAQHADLEREPSLIEDPDTPSSSDFESEAVSHTDVLGFEVSHGDCQPPRQRAPEPPSSTMSVHALRGHAVDAVVLNSIELLDDWPKSERNALLAACEKSSEENATEVIQQMAAMRVLDESENLQRQLEAKEMAVHAQADRVSMLGQALQQVLAGMVSTGQPDLVARAHDTWLLWRDYVNPPVPKHMSEMAEQSALDQQGLDLALAKWDPDTPIGVMTAYHQLLQMDSLHMAHERERLLSWAHNILIQLVETTLLLLDALASIIEMVKDAGYDQVYEWVPSDVRTLLYAA